MGIPAPGQRGVGHCLPGSFQGAGKKVDLRVIVPKADPSVLFDGFQLTGLNNVSYREVEQVDRKYSYDSFALVERAPIELDPYTTVEGESGVVQFTKEGRITFSKTHEADLQLFRNKEDLYAGDLALKVIQFSKIAVKVALQQDFDIIHAHDWLTYLAGVEVKKPRASPWWCTCTLPSLTGPERMPAAGFTTLKNSAWNRRMPLSRSANTREPSPAGTMPLTPIRYFPFTTARIRSKSSKARKIPGKLVLFLGRLTAQKGPGFFLQIAAKVLEQTDDVRFVMAGTGEKLRQLIESGAFKGVGDKFHFTGFLNKDKVNELLSITDIYCMPSVSEPFGLSALEAAQFNIPAVISKQSGVAEVMKGALKADFWDVNKMAEHIVHLCTDEELYRKVVEQSTEDIKASTWDAAADKVIRVYEHVLNR